MMRLTGVLVLIALAPLVGCTPRQDGVHQTSGNRAGAEAICSRIEIEDVGNVEIVTDHIKGPVFGGRGPDGPSMAITLRPDVYPDSDALELSLWSADGLEPPLDSRHAPVGKCKHHRSVSAISCGALVLDGRLYLDAVFPSSSIDFDELVRRTQQVAVAIDKGAFSCPSAEPWVEAKRTN